MGVRGPQGPEDSAFHTGQIVTWDRVTGANTVNIQGTIFPNVRSVHSTAVGGSWFQPGDTVLVIRKQTQWFILGRITTTNNAASGFQSQTLSSADVTMNTGGAWVSLTGFSNQPAVSAYTTEKGVIVIWSCTLGVDVKQTDFPAIANPSVEANASFAVSGASSIAAGAFTVMTTIVNHGLLNPPANFGSNVLQTTTGIFAFGATAGLVPGLNTFTMKFRSLNGSGRFLCPGINVIPL
jgi:hypothetical protein